MNEGAIVEFKYFTILLKVGEKMRDRFTISWDVAKRERCPTALSEERRNGTEYYLGKNGKTYRFASMSQSGSIVSADYEEVENPIPGKVH
jgi:hypothetical protein